MRRLFITGGAGFIGSALSRKAIGDGHDVCVFDKLTYAGTRGALREIDAHPRFRFIEGDICDRAAVSAALEAFTPDAILHLAAESHVDRSIDGAGDFIRTNIVGTFELLEAARSWRDRTRRDDLRFLHISTDEVFGALDAHGAFNEEARYAPRSPYAASKASSDHLVRAWAHTYGLPVLISNCSNNYGPFQLPEKLIPLMILNALEGHELPVYGDGLQRRDWLYVDDHVNALLLILERGRVGETYAVGPRAEHANIDVVTRICDLIGADARERVRHVEDRPGHDRRYAIDPTKIETELGWRPQIGFEDGLVQTVRWYLDNDWWWKPLREAGHGRARLGAKGAP